MEGLQLQIEELRAELGNLRIGAAGAVARGQSRDVSLVAGIKEWTGEAKGKSVNDFFAQIETLAKVSGWTNDDKALIAKAKFQGLALQFLSGREELVLDACTYETLKQAFIERFSDKLPDQYYYTRLQDAVQGLDDGAKEFSDRCRKLCQRTIRKARDEATQRIINEEAERRLLAAYINGLRGVVGQQVQFQMPATMEQAVRIAVTVENTEKHKNMAGGSKRVFTARREIECFKCNRRGHYARDCWQDPRVSRSVGLPASSRTAPFRSQGFRRGQSNSVGRGIGRSTWRDRGNRNEERRNISDGARPSGLQCFHSREVGHIRQECPRMSQPAHHPNGQGSAPRSPASNPQIRTRK